MTLCEKCRGKLKIATSFIKIADGEGETEIEIEACPECKIIWEITVIGYTIDGEGERRG